MSLTADGRRTGAENNPPSFTSNKHYEVCKHFSLDGHTRIPDILLIGTKTRERLPLRMQKWVQQAAEQSSAFQRQLWRKETDRALETAAAEGVTIYEVDTALFAARVAPMLEEVENAALSSLVHQIRGMR